MSATVAPTAIVARTKMLFRSTPLRKWASKPQRSLSVRSFAEQLIRPRNLTGQEPPERRRTVAAGRQILLSAGELADDAAG